MADLWRATASLPAFSIAAMSSAKSLYETIKRFKNRNKTLTRLGDGVEELIHALKSLAEVKIPYDPLLILLEGLVKLCGKLCHEFEHAMIHFNNISKADLRDWAKVKSTRGDMNEFIDTIARHKSTISIGLSITTLHASKVSHQDLKEYTEFIEETEPDLTLHLQRIIELITQSTVKNINASGKSVSLEDEKEVAEQSLRICEYARVHAARLSERKESTNASGMPISLEDEREVCEQCLRVCVYVPLQLRQSFGENRVGFTKTIGCSQKSLELAATKEISEHEDKISRLRSDTNISEQCSDDCTVTSGIPDLKVYKAREVIANDGSDQILVTTLEDRLNMKKASCAGTSARPVGSVMGRLIASCSSNQIVANSRSGYFDIGEATSTGTSAQLVASTTGDILPGLVNMNYSS